MAEGSKRRIAHVKESSWGVPSGTAFQIDRVLADAGIAIDRNSFVSNEFRSDRAIGGHKLGVKKASVKFPFELSYGSFDDFIESAMCDSWVTAGTPTTGLSVTVVAGSTNTMAATGIGSGVAAGDWVKVSGFTAGNVGNNGYWKVTVSTANLLTLGEAKDASGTSLLTACGPISSITVTRMGAIKTGITLKSLTIEEAFTDINVYNEALGCAVDQFSLSLAPDSIVTGSFDLASKGLASDSPKVTPYGVTYPAADTNNKIDTFSGFLRVDGQICAVITTGELTLKNSIEAMFPLFQTSAYRMGMGRSNLTGSISVYFLDATYPTKYLNETPMALSIMLMEADLSRGYAIDVPVAKITSQSKSVAENNIVLTMPFQSLPDSVSGLVNWKISKLA
jgi:hypothetical protein